MQPEGGGLRNGQTPNAHDGHPGGLTPNETPIGEFSYFVAHLVGGGGAKTMAFISGSYTVLEELFRCNTCPPDGAGKDINDVVALSGAKVAATLRTLGVSLWTTQFVDDIGPTTHAQLRLDSTGAGVTSGCDKGTVYENLIMDICVDDPYPIPVKWSFTTYSVDQGQHADPGNPGRCSGPDCYVRNVIIPAALVQSGAAKNVQVRQASTVLPDSSPFGMAGATIDLILFAYTTQKIDQDGDGTEDRVDPCPTDPGDFCVLNLFTLGNCPAGQAFCPDALGGLGCRDAFLCNARLDPNQDCSVDGKDFRRIAGEDDGLDGSEAFQTGLPIGPFSP